MPGEQPAAAPQHLLGPELLQGHAAAGLLEPVPDRGGAAEHALEHAGRHRRRTGRGCARGSGTASAPARARAAGTAGPRRAGRARAGRPGVGRRSAGTRVTARTRPSAGQQPARPGAGEQRRSSQHPLLVGQPADAHHHPVGDQADARRRSRARRALRCCCRRRPPPGRSDSSARTIHGAATASRAALTVQPCRVSSSARVRASSRRNAERVRSSRPRSVPPTSRAIRSDSTIRSPTGSARPALRRSRRLVEPAGRAVVLAEPRERPAQLLRAADADLGQRLGQRQPGPHAGRQVVDDLRPQVAQLGAALALAGSGPARTARRTRSGRRPRRSRASATRRSIAIEHEAADADARGDQRARA